MELMRNEVYINYKKKRKENKREKDLQLFSPSFLLFYPSFS